MNVYAIAPLIATIAYIPLLITTAGNRPWQKRTVSFVLFLFTAMSWSFIVYLFRSNLFPGAALALFKLSVLFFALTVIQFHFFTSSFIPQDKNLVIFHLTFANPDMCECHTGIFTNDVVADVIGHGSYQLGIGIVALPLLSERSEIFTFSSM
jgi:hypothetical protein